MDNKNCRPWGRMKHQLALHAVPFQASRLGALLGVAGAAWLVLALPAQAAGGTGVAVRGELAPLTPLRSSAPGPKPGAPVGCLISPQRVADLGATAPGVIANMRVDVGDRVRAGDVVAELFSEVESASAGAASARAGQEADVLAAQAAVELARLRHARQRDLLGEGFISQQAVDQAHAELRVAEQRVAQAQGQRAALAQDVQVARAQLRQRQVRAPFDGVVVERFRQPGERVEDRPLLRVAQVDTLRVELILPAARFGQVGLRDNLPVQPEIAGLALVQAMVTHIDPVIDAASNTFRVRLSLANPDRRIPAGARCSLGAGAGLLSEPIATMPPKPQGAAAAPAAVSAVSVSPAAAAAQRQPPLDKVAQLR